MSAEVWASHHLPPDCPSRRTFADVCRKIPGAVRLGKAWIVEREAWTEARRPKPRLSSVPTVRAPRSIDEEIRDAGFRLTGST